MLKRKFFSAKQSRPTAAQSQRSTQNPQHQTFILEPILTPSGLIDAGDDLPDVAALDLADGLVDEVDVPDLEGDLPDEIPDESLDRTADEIPEIEDGAAEITDVAVPDDAMEEISFIVVPEDGLEDTIVDETVNETVDAEENVTVGEAVAAERLDPETDSSTLEAAESDTSAIANESEDLAAGEATEASREPSETTESNADSVTNAIADDIELAAASRTALTDSVSAIESGVFTVGETGEVTVDFLFDGGRYEGELSIFSLEGLDPNDADFAQIAAQRALSNSELGHIVISDRAEGARFSGFLGEGDLNIGEYLGPKTVTMNPGDRFAFLLAPNSTVRAVARGSEALFSLATANPGDAFHMGQLADVTGDGNTFVMEDLRFERSDRDYNDLIFKVDGATGNAVDLDEVIDPARDWRDTDLGQELLAFAAPDVATDIVIDDVNTEVVPEVESVLQDLNTDLAALLDNPDLALEEPDADLALESDRLLAEAEAEFAAALAELAGDEFADVDALTGQFEFAREDQPLIGLIDTGLDADNPDLDYDRIQLGHDYIDDDGNPLLAANEGDDHGTRVLEVISATQNNDIGIDGVNDDAPIWVGRAVGSGEWHRSLVDFVDAARESGQPNAVANLSFDLIQTDADGNLTTRTEFTPDERAAIEYARDHGVLIVAAAGNQGVEALSALGAAAQEFNNVITVGAADEEAERADYSSYGTGLDLLAYGARLDESAIATLNASPNLSQTLTAEEQQALERIIQISEQSDDTTAEITPDEETNALQAVQKMLQSALDSSTEIDGSNADSNIDVLAGTSIAAAKVTGAVSQIWAANPDLSFAQVKAILKATAVDLHTPGEDIESGAGLLNLGLAVQTALATVPDTTTPGTLPEITIPGLDSALTPGERPTFLKKLWRGVKKVFKKVVRVVKKVVKVVKKVFTVVKKVFKFITKAVPIIRKIGSFFKTVATKFLALPILGKIGVVLGGVALVGAAIAGVVGLFRKKSDGTVVVTNPVPGQILDLEAIWNNVLTAPQRNTIRNALLNGLDPQYLPLFDGSDPDQILPLLDTLNGLTPNQQNNLGPHLLNGVPASWISFFDGTDPSNPFVPVATVGNAWNSLTAAQQNVLRPFLLNGVQSAYGRPIFDGDPDDVINILGVLSDPSLNDTQRSLLVSFMFNPGGVPTQYEARFP